VFNLLICPSTQVPRIYGAKHLKLLNEGVNEGWNSAITSYLFTVLVHSLMIMWGLDDRHSRKPEFLLVRDFELKETLKSAQCNEIELPCFRCTSQFSRGFSST
jgi:hypothetical protein